MNWYYADGGRQAGPVEEAALDELVRQGVVRDDTLVWREGLASWQPHGVVRPRPAAPPPPAPPIPAPPMAHLPRCGSTLLRSVRAALPGIRTEHGRQCRGVFHVPPHGHAEDEPESVPTRRSTLQSALHAARNGGGAATLDFGFALWLASLMGLWGSSASSS